MFESTLNPSWNARSRFGLTTLTSFGLEALLVAVLLIAPMLRPPAIPLLRRLSTPISLSQTPAEPKPSVEHSALNSVAHRSATEIVLRQPAQIPNHILITSEPTPPAFIASSSGAGTAVNGDFRGLLGAVGTGAAPVIPRPAVTIEHPVRLSHMSEGDLIRKVMPAYPALARSARIQGTVVLQAMISKQGTIENLRLLSGHPMLAPAAIEAVKQWRYRPYILNSEPVEVETQITVNFALNN